MSRTADPGRVPFLDIGRHEAPIAGELMNAVGRVIESRAYVLGAAVADFEAAMAQRLGVEHAVGVGSGSDALELALRALDLQAGDEVITSPFTFFSTAGAIENVGGRVVFAEVDAATFNLDPAAVRELITERTRAIIPVHLYGQMAEMAGLIELARPHGIVVVEDAAQAIDARARLGDRWQHSGTIGAVGCFSFYPTKNLGGWGDGGLVVTDDGELAERIRSLRIHGRPPDGSYRHTEVGVNSRLDAIQAAVLQAKLPHLDDWTEARRASAADYDRRLADVDGVVTPVAAEDRYHVYNQYTIRADRRDDLRAHLSGLGIGSMVYYPLPLHLQPCFAHLGYEPGDLPGAERAADVALSLPVFPGLTGDERARVCEAIRDFYA